MKPPSGHLSVNNGGGRGNGRIRPKLSGSEGIRSIESTRPRPVPSKVSDQVKYAIRDLASAAKAEEMGGKKRVLRLNIGDPCKFDFRPPREMLMAAADALRAANRTGYADSAGISELQAVISGLERCKEYEIFITAGLSEGMDFALRTLLDPGKSILLPNPVYPLYPTLAATRGAEARYYNCDEKGIPDVEHMESLIIDTTRAIVVNNPNNPTGAVYPYDVLYDIVCLAAKYNLPIFADEIYDLLLLGDAKMHNLRDIARNTGVIVFSGNGMSKNFFFPGARIGWVAIHNDKGGEFLDAMLRMCNPRLSINAELQIGALEALSINTYDFRQPHIEKLRKRRDILCNAISQIPGLSIPAYPDGAFYGWIKVDGYVSDGKHHKLPDWNFVLDFLRTEGVLVVPGSAFLKNQPDEMYFRTTFLPDEKTLGEAMDKLNSFMRARLGK